MFQMDLEYNKGILFVRLKGNLTKKKTYEINNYLVPVLLKHKIKYLVFNLYELDSIDESGVNALLNTKCAIRTNKGKIYACEVGDFLKEDLKRIHIKEIENELLALKLIEV